MMHLYRFFRALGRYLWGWLSWLPGFLLCVLWDHKVDCPTPPWPGCPVWHVKCDRCGTYIIVWYDRS